MQNEQDNCIPRFFLKSVIDNDKTREEGSNVWMDAEYVEILMPNSRDTWVGPVDQKHMDRWPKHYEAFKNGREAPVDGTPLDVWPAITPAVVENLKRANVKTVEALARMPETNVQRFGPDMLQLIHKARTYIENRDDTAEASKLVEENKDLRRQLEDLQAQVAALKKKPKKKKAA